MHIAIAGLRDIPQKKKPWTYGIAERTARSRKVNLKPCPFCGGQPEIVTPEETDGQYWFIACTNDNCWGIAGTELCDTETEAIDKWNRRDGDADGED